MNARPRFRLSSRADLSPVRASRTDKSTSAVAASRVESSTVLHLEPAPEFGARPAWPTWHRGALDRLQPELTRYRD